MRIGIDARFSRSPGVERYYSSLIKALVAIDRENRYLVYHPTEGHRARLGVSAPNISSRVLGVDAYDLREQVVLCRAIRADRLDLFHATNNWVTPLVCACPLVITLHDMIAKTHPKLIKPFSRLYAGLMYPWSIRAARRVFTVSEYSKAEIVRYYPRSRPKLVVTSNGVDEGFLQKRTEGEIARVRRDSGIDSDYLLTVGALMWHKNVLGLIEAYKSLGKTIRARYGLVIVGRSVPGHDEYESQVRAAVRGERITILQGVTLFDLSCLYQGATAFVFPSRQEGFGIPLVEAMSSGAPVVSSRPTVMTEICGEAALYFDPVSREEMRDAILRVLEDAALRKQLVEAGRKRARLFTWESTARTTLRAYEEAARA